MAAPTPNTRGCLLVVALLTGCAHAPVGACPEVALGEAAADCPWAGLSRALARSASVSHDLARMAPRLWRDLAHDARHPSLAALWAQSRNYDEHAHATIVPAPILSALGQRARLPGDGEIAHAGLTHTYGYLFSTLRTPFGYKRARWVDHEIERGLHIEEGLLGPSPAAGTLLANATCVLAKLTMFPPPITACVGAAPALARWAPPTTYERLLETVSTAHGTVTLGTVWISYSAGRGLVVYTVTDAHGTHLVTAFSVDTTVWTALVDPATLGEQTITTRWNAFVPGVSDAATPLRGERKVVGVAKTRVAGR